MKKIILVCLFVLMAASAHAEPKPVEAVASFSILADLVQQVGGDAVHVRALVPAGGDAHTYRPTPADARALAAADLVVINGLGFEGWADRLIKSSGFKGALVTASTGVAAHPLPDDDEEQKDHHHHHDHEGALDPHAWQDVANARLYVQTIAAALSKLRPDRAATIAERARGYDAELAALDADIKRQIATIPAPQRKIITSHDAFGYFATAYGVTFMAPQGISTESEPKAAQVAKLISQIKAEKVPTVFFESMASPRLIKRLAADAGAKVGEAVYSDSLSPPSGPAPTYTAMMRHNLALFAAAMAATGK